MQSMRSRLRAMLKARYSGYIILGALLSVLPLIPGVTNSHATLLGSMVYLSIAALGFQVLLGYSGQISLGHTAFIGMGAYLSGYIVQELHLPFPLAFLAAAIIPLFLGLLLGLIALRLEGYYLAIATLGLAESIRIVFIEATSLTKGFSGFSARYPVLFGLQLSKQSTYILMVTILVCLMMVVKNFISASTGRALAAMRSSESAAQAMGVSLFKYKLMAFAISTAFAGAAGSLYIHFFRYSDPTIWNSGVSLNLVVACIVGGIASVEGAVLGAAFVVLMPELLKMVPILNRFNGAPFVISGVVIVLVLLFYPGGLVNAGKSLPGLLARLIGNRRARSERGVERAAR